MIVKRRKASEGQRIASNGSRGITKVRFGSDVCRGVVHVVFHAFAKDIPQLDDISRVYLDVRGEIDAPPIYRVVQIELVLQAVV
jgi:hypothetical protein